MKNLILLAVIIFILPFQAISQESWQEWQTTACYDNIQFRLKKEIKKGKRTQWSIQFRNNLEKTISFNYAVTEDSEDYLTTHRKTLYANEVSNPVSFYTQSTDFFVLVNKMSYSVNAQEFVPCDP